MMKTFEQDLDIAVAYHGHLCAGQIIGVRMARLGLKLLGIDNPESERDLIVYIEADRCLADAVGTVTHCKLGRRRLKWLDYGKSAATFVHTATGKAVRVAAGKRFKPNDSEDIAAFYRAITDEELFTHMAVTVDIKPEDMPGKPLVSKVCDKCGETVMDNRHIEKDGKNLCKSCAHGAYYSMLPR